MLWGFDWLFRRMRALLRRCVRLRLTKPAGTEDLNGLCGDAGSPGFKEFFDKCFQHSDLGFITESLQIVCSHRFSEPQASAPMEQVQHPSSDPIKIEADIAYEFIRYLAIGVCPEVAKLGGFERCCDGL